MNYIILSGRFLSNVPFKIYICQLFGKCLYFLYDGDEDILTLVCDCNI